MGKKKYIIGSCVVVVILMIVVLISTSYHKLASDESKYTVDVALEQISLNNMNKQESIGQYCQF